MLFAVILLAARPILHPELQCLHPQDVPYHQDNILFHPWKLFHIAYCRLLIGSTHRNLSTAFVSPRFFSFKTIYLQVTFRHDPNNLYSYIAFKAPCNKTLARAAFERFIVLYLRTSFFRLAKVFCIPYFKCVDMAIFRLNVFFCLL